MRPPPGQQKDPVKDMTSAVILMEENGKDFTRRGKAPEGGEITQLRARGSWRQGE